MIRIMKVLQILFTICLWLTGHSVIAQELNTTKLDSYFDALEENNKFMGSVAVSRGGELIYKRTVGYSDVESSVKANENTKYRIGSISKTFTTILVFKAIEEGKLELDQTIKSFFPKVKHADKITIENLLNHRSGIHSFTNDESYLEWSTEARSRKEMIKIIVDGGSDFAPDTKAEYSNSNFVLLTYILEDIYGRSYSALVKEYVADPLQLKQTYVGEELDTSKGESKSYWYKRGWELASVTDMTVPVGAGAIVSTPADLVVFSDALFSGKLISKKSLEKMMSVKDGFGMGLFTVPFGERTAYGHTGGIDGFGSVFSYFPEDNVSFAMVYNGLNYEFNAISIAVLSAVFDQPYDIAEFTIYDISSVDLEMYTGVYASEQIPLKITILKEDQGLTAQATGQSAFPLEPVDEHIFSFDPAGVVLEFNPGEKTIVLKQRGMEFQFSKE